MLSRFTVLQCSCSNFLREKVNVNVSESRLPTTRERHSKRKREGEKFILRPLFLSRSSRVLLSLSFFKSFAPDTFSLAVQCLAGKPGPGAATALWVLASKKPGRTATGGSSLSLLSLSLSLFLFLSLPFPVTSPSACARPGPGPGQPRSWALRSPRRRRERPRQRRRGSWPRWRPCAR